MCGITPPEVVWDGPRAASSPTWPANHGPRHRGPRSPRPRERTPRFCRSCAAQGNPRTTEMHSKDGLAVRVIPCLDVDDGRVVKGVNFENLRDAGDPVELAAAYDAEGADELTFLDVTASSSGRTTMLEVVPRTAEQVFIPLTVGGGVRTVADVDTLLRAGADKVSINTAAIARPDLLAEMAVQFGSQCIVLSVDARTVPVGSDPTPSGWEAPTPRGRP